MLAIIILNWNGFSDTKACVESLSNATLPVRQIFIVDNGSNSQDKSKMRDYCKQNRLSFVDLPKNLGFAEGNNVAIREALENPRISHFLLLNNDTTIEPTCVTDMLATLKAHPDAAIINPQIFYHSTPNIIWANGSTYNPTFGKSTLRKNHSKEPDTADIKLEQIVGCCMLLPRKAIEAVGLMDSDYFSYYEETDWAERFKMAGFTLWLSASAKMYHKVAQSTGGGHTPFSTYYLVRNRGHFIRKNMTGFSKTIALSSLLFECLARSILYLFTGRMRLYNATWKGYFDFNHRKTGPTWSE